MRTMLLREGMGVFVFQKTIPIKFRIASGGEGCGRKRSWYRRKNKLDCEVLAFLYGDKSLNNLNLKMSH